MDPENLIGGLALGVVILLILEELLKQRPKKALKMDHSLIQQQEADRRWRAGQREMQRAIDVHEDGGWALTSGSFKHAQLERLDLDGNRQVIIIYLDGDLEVVIEGEQQCSETQGQ